MRWRWLGLCFAWVVTRQGQIAIEGVATLAGDEEATARRCAKGTADKLAADKPVTGLTKLIELAEQL